jgi:catechol 2,3-dioxygenase-like lactoylglutathione lyase family enzyme
MPMANDGGSREFGEDCKVENTIPVLAVSDLQASIRFYCDVLGFIVDWGGQDDSSRIASVSRDGHPVMLQRREPLAPGCVWIGVSSLTILWDKIRSHAEVVVVERPTNQHWALEMMIQDPDENILWIGAAPLKGVPFGSEPAESQLPRP